MTDVRLTQLAKRAGCAAKQPPGYLFGLLGALPTPRDPNLLVGSAGADDAAVYRLDDERALITTTDFFTPIVDQPFDFGRIAAANALSDVYAMGGRPLTALNLVGFPDHLLPPEVLGDILRGGAVVAEEAGIDIAGGHTIKSDEPIYGLAVTGVVHPERVVTNAGGERGDALILTKPLGLGIITTAAKQGIDTLGAIDEAIALMVTLNRGAAEAMSALEDAVHAATDVTGFGLLGHLRNVALASRLGARVSLGRVPFIPAARRYVSDGIAPGGTHANRRYLLGIPDGERWVDVGPADDAAQLLLCDAQTSGGLLIAVAPERAGDLLGALDDRGVGGHPIGHLDGDLEPGHITVVP